MPDAKRVHASKLRQERAAFALIKALSGATILILAAIVGFILWKGLRYSNETRSPYLRRSELAPEGVAILVNKAIRIEALDFGQLRDIYSDEYINWAKLCEDATDLVPLALDPSASGGRAAERLLFGESPAWGASVEFAPTPEALVERLRSTPGAIAVLPQAGLPQAAAAGAAARRVALRREVVAMNPEAARLVGDFAVEEIDEDALGGLLSGKVRDWSELGGPELPLRPMGGGEPANAADIASIPGAVGVANAREALDAGLPLLRLRGRESGWNLSPRYLVEAPRLSGRAGGISTIILNTLLMLLITVGIAGPIGIAAAIYLVEYARQGPFLRILRLGTETLAGIPSIIFGLFGMLAFVDFLGFGFGLASGCLTLSLMILPTIVRTSEEAIKTVPRSLREGSLALGATKLQTLFRVVVPAAGPGILTGLILGVGRAVGETAALLFTMGSDYKLAKGLFSSARAMSTHIYLLFAEGISFDRAFSTATVLIVVVLGFNLAAKRLVKRMSRNAA